MLCFRHMSYATWLYFSGLKINILKIKIGYSLIK